LLMLIEVNSQSDVFTNNWIHMLFMLLFFRLCVHFSVRIVRLVWNGWAVSEWVWWSHHCTVISQQWLSIRLPRCYGTSKRTIISLWVLSFEDIF
jgi:hypothetical protein